MARMQHLSLIARTSVHDNVIIFLFNHEIKIHIKQFCVSALSLLNVVECMKRYLAGKGTPVREHVPYSPDLAPCDFFLFLKIKSALKGIRFESMEDVKRKSSELLKALTKEDFHHRFERWKN